MNTAKFIIMDSTNNTGKDYISADGSNSSLEENAITFETKEEAENFAKSLSGNGDWFYITEKENEND